MSKQETKQTKSVVTNQGVDFLSMKDITLTVSDIDVSTNYAIWVRALLQNWRQGTVGCKDRSQVSFANRKPWKQKGTGRARAGSARSPLWRSGGVTFGPQPRTHSLKISKRAKIGVLQRLFAELIDNKRVIALDWETTQPSTKASYALLKDSGIVDSKINLFLNHDDITNWMAFRNLKNVQILSFDDVNAYDLSNSDYLVVLKKDLNDLKEMVSKWN